MLILSDGYWSAVTSDNLCDQNAIRICKWVPKGILRSADLVNEYYYFSLLTSADFSSHYTIDAFF